MTAGYGQGSGAEQRRFARVPINLEGLIGIAGRAPVACTVRDFCVGGMFISADPAAYANLPVNPSAVLFFALFVDGVKQDFQIHLEIARAVAKGIGVSFVNPDAKAVELLGHLAAASAPPPAPENSAALGRTQQRFAPEFAALSGPLATLCAEHVRRLCERFVARVDEVLFLAARDAGSNVEQTRLLDAQREIRGRKQRIIEAVPRQVETGVAILADPLAELEKDPKSVGLADLSLVDKDEFEEFLVISEMVSELEPEFTEPLFGLGRRFSYLANREVDLGSMPISPGVLCNAVSDCLKGLQSDRRANARVYKVLHEVMSGNLGGFYDEVNAMLIERGILPVIEKDKPAPRKRAESTGFDTPTPDPEPPIAAQTNEEALLDLMPGPDNYQGRPASYGGAPGPSSAAPHSAVAPAMPSAPPAGYAGQAGQAGGHVAHERGYAVQGAQPSVPAGSYAVQGAQPSMPAGGYAVQGAQPSMPAGGYAVQGAQPSMPADGYAVQGAPPSVPAGGYAVQGAPPNVPAGGYAVQGAQPSVPAGSYIVQGAAPSVPAGAYADGGSALEGGVAAVGGGTPLVSGAATVQLGDALFGGTANLVALPAGWVSTGARHVAPTMQQAYSTAQAQLALRRQLVPDGGPDLSESLRMRGDYSRTQILDGLSDLQEAFAQTDSPSLLDVAALKRRITEALIGDGAPHKLIGGEAADAIEVVANLFSALLHDAFIAKSAKNHLTRLQPAVHRAAMLDQEFFASTQHPVRQLVDRISQVRDGQGDSFQRRNERVEQLVVRANRSFLDDVAVISPLVEELDGILGEQRDEYQHNVQNVVASCEQQQRVLEERRGQSLEATDTSLERANLPEEWNRWLERSRELEVGQQAMMNANSANPNLVSLAWKEPRNHLFVFVDEVGNKASTLTLQQVAMYLRRGMLRTLDTEIESAPLERAMFGVVDQLHSQVEEQATRDPLTGFLSRRFFIEAIDASLAGGDAGGTKHAACCHISLENLKQVNDEFGVETGDGLLKSVADALQQALRVKGLIYGRLSGSELGVFWPTGGVQTALKRLQSANESLQAVSLVLDNSEPEDGDRTVQLSEQSLSSAETVISAIRAEIVIGLTGSDDALVQAEGLLGVARDACETARGMGIGSLFVAGNETEQRRALEQMVAYAGKALERDRLVLLAQSVVSLTDSDLPPALHVVVSARDRADKSIPAHLFAPALARARCAADIDLWSFRQTLAWMQAHEDELERYAVVIVPLSSASMKNEQLPQQLMTEFMETPVPPGKICFEIPDRDVVANLAEAGDLITTLREFGCRFVLDEFGSGHDNYDYLKRLEVDYVTIKSSFVIDAQKNPKDFAMAKSINELVHFMGKKTMAKQEHGLDLAPTMREIGVDFLYDLSEQAQLAP
jgi:diguanylate cyclase (GGDEF)-like protein